MKPEKYDPVADIAATRKRMRVVPSGVDIAAAQRRNTQQSHGAWRTQGKDVFAAVSGPKPASSPKRQPGSNEGHTQSEPYNDPAVIAEADRKIEEARKRGYAEALAAIKAKAAELHNAGADEREKEIAAAQARQKAESANAWRQPGKVSKP